MTDRLWTREFFLYFVARAVSLLGDAMMPVVAALAVGKIYGASGVGFVLAVWTAPFVLLILFGGVLADRLGARALMVGADLVRIATQATVMVAFLQGTPPLWLLMVMSALSGSAAAMFQPGVNGMVTLVAKDLQRANATVKVADAMAQLIGPAIGGLLVVAVGAGWVYGIDAATFAISAVCLAALRLPQVAAVAPERRVLHDLRVGWYEFRSRSWMWSVILIWVAYGIFFFGPIIPVGSVAVSEQWGAAGYGWVLSAFGGGTVLGGLIALRLRPYYRLRSGGLAMLGVVLAPLTIALQLPMAALLAGHLLAGAAWAFWSVMWQTSVQSQVTQEVINRVTAYEIAGSVSGLAIGQALAGPAAVHFGTTQVLLTSVVVGLTGVVLLLTIPAIRNLKA